jgi:hypothetical protein
MARTIHLTGAVASPPLLGSGTSDQGSSTAPIVHGSPRGIPR